MLRVRVRVTSDITAPSYRSLMLAINGALSLKELMNKILTVAGLLNEEDLILHLDGFVLSLEERIEDVIRDDDILL